MIGKLYSKDTLFLRVYVGEAVKHGMYRHPIYSSWLGMKRRCYNVKDPSYYNYGGRGITVCVKWLESFDNFKDDMLPTWELGLSLDRIDNNGNYEPSNCRWATRKEQRANQRKPKEYKTFGTVPLKGVSRHRKKYKANINVKGKIIHIGVFETAEQAAEAFQKAALKYRGALRG